MSCKMGSIFSAEAFILHLEDIPNNITGAWSPLLVAVDLLPNSYNQNIYIYTRQLADKIYIFYILYIFSIFFMKTLM